MIPNPAIFHVAVNPDNGWLYYRTDRPAALSEVQEPYEYGNPAVPWKPSKDTPREAVMECLLYVSREPRSIGEVVRILHAGIVWECVLVSVPAASGAKVMGRIMSASVPVILRCYPATYNDTGLLEGEPGGWLASEEKVEA